MSAICYFIGGPLDLTKTTIKYPERTLYAAEKPTFTYNQISTRKETANAMEILMRRHVYHRLPSFHPPVHAAAEQPLIYVYVGIEPDKP